MAVEVVQIGFTSLEGLLNSATLKIVIKEEKFICLDTSVPIDLIEFTKWKEALPFFEEKFVYRYNNERYHESLNNLTPADVYFGRGEMILKERERLKKMAIIGRRNEYQKLKLTTNQKKHLSLNY